MTKTELCRCSTPYQPYGRVMTMINNTKVSIDITIKLYNLGYDYSMVQCADLM